MGKRRGLISFGKKRNKQKSNGDVNDDGDDARRAKAGSPPRRRRRSRSGSRGREGGSRAAWAREARDHLAVLSGKMRQQIGSECEILSLNT